MVKIRNIEIADFPLILAPMEDVSDPPFRFLCKEEGADLMYTEFISVEGLIRDADKSLRKLDIYENERPIGIQVFGGEIDSMVEAMAVVEDADPEIIDINFGCPVNRVVCKMAGAGILQDIPKMIKLTESVVKATSKPVTVKTRLGWDDSSKNIVEVAEMLQDTGIKALTIHGRTRSQFYKGSADWTLIGEVKNNPRMSIPIIGNGDIDSPQKAAEYFSRYGVDGIMIGRATVGRPWIFRDIKHYFNTGELLPEPTASEKVDLALYHLEQSLNFKSGNRAIFEMRRHLSNYFKGLSHFRDTRLKLLTTTEPDEIRKILEDIREKWGDQRSEDRSSVYPV